MCKKMEASTGVGAGAREHYLGIGMRLALGLEMTAGTNVLGCLSPRPTTDHAVLSLNASQLTLNHCPVWEGSTSAVAPPLF